MVSEIRNYLTDIEMLVLWVPNLVPKVRNPLPRWKGSLRSDDKQLILDLRLSRSAHTGGGGTKGIEQGPFGAMRFKKPCGRLQHFGCSPSARPRHFSGRSCYYGGYNHPQFKVEGRLLFFYLTFLHTM